MRRWLIRIGVVLALVASVVVARNTVLKPDPLDVRAVAAARGQVEETVTNTRAGTIKALRCAAPRSHPRSAAGRWRSLGAKGSASRRGRPAAARSYGPRRAAHPLPP